MISLGHSGRGGAKPASMTSSHSLSCRHLHLSVFPSLSPPPTPSPSQPLLLSFPRGNASIHLCLYCRPHTSSCHGEEPESSPDWWERFWVIATARPRSPTPHPGKKKKNEHHLFWVSSFWMKGKKCAEVFKSYRKAGERCCHLQMWQNERALLKPVLNTQSQAQ